MVVFNKIIWPLSWPLRKIYYFIEFQYYKRVLKQCPKL
jgi:hypothetical protein